MSDMIQIKIENARAVQNALNAFEKKISKKIVREGVKAAWHPLLVRAKANARALDSRKTKQKKSKRMGHLIAKALVLKPFTKKKPGQYGMHVSMSFYEGDVYYITGARSLINVSTGARVKGGESGRYYIPVAIEYGHAFPGRGRESGGGKHPPKDVAAKPFLRPAADAAVPNAPTIFAGHLNKAIAEENARR